MAVLRLAILSTLLVSCQGQGLTLNVYDNMGFAGTPISTSVVDTTAFTVPAGKPFSAELIGTISFPPEGHVYNFDCNWTASTMG